MICPKCGTENKNTNIRCEYCSNELIDINDNEYQSSLPNFSVEHIEKAKKTIGCISNIILLIFIGPFLLIGLLFTGIGLFSNISEYNEAKDYAKTTATLNGYDDCHYDDGIELCTAIYEYEIDGITYYVSPNLSSNRDNFDKNETVYYNPNNPSESLIYAGWNIITIVGIGFICVTIIIFIIKNIILNKVFKIKEDTTTNV